MTPFTISALQVLESMQPEEVALIAQALNEDGIILEGGGTCLSSTIVNYWEPSCEDRLRDHGYLYGRVRPVAKFFPGYGQLYALFDESRVTYEDALGTLKQKRDSDPEDY